ATGDRRNATSSSPPLYRRLRRREPTILTRSRFKMTSRHTIPLSTLPRLLGVARQALQLRFGQLAKNLVCAGALDGGLAEHAGVLALLQAETAMAQEVGGHAAQVRRERGGDAGPAEEADVALPGEDELHPLRDVDLAVAIGIEEPGAGAPDQVVVLRREFA